MRFRSRFSRLIATATSLTTLLCLGCTGLEPVIDAILGPAAQVAMVCSGGTMATTAGSQETIAATGQSGASAHYACGCQSCTAPPAAIPVVSIVRVAPAHSVNADVAQLVGITTRPLFPPPQRTL